MTSIKVSIVGYGLSGKCFHAPLIKVCPELDIVAIVSSRADEIKQDFPSAKQCTFDEALKQSDLVIITTPHQFHFEQAKAALLAGKHVVVEKPFTKTTQEATELFELAKQNKCNLKVFFNRRFDADFLTLKKLIESGSLGEIITIESHFDRFRPTPKENAWREKPGSQSGVWWDLGPHLIDQAIQLMGTPEDIDFDIGSQRHAPADDFFNVTMKYSGGRRIHLRASCIVKDFGFRFRVHGTKGSALFKTLDVQENQLRTGMSPSDSSFGVYPESSIKVSEGIMYKPEKGSYLNFYKDVISSIKENKSNDELEKEILFNTKVLLGNKNF